ncbi:E3 ubiquitin ligase BIG BROTHER-related-like [Rutidosis leptorrhynchoides]|uniref:E3 ubiquitin ligase BIG BROTHER-related-like n=1 Tax=Rutidosis leptorrhynchoides TaxID=125765 RepID=UPI003A98F0E8
MSRSVTLYDHYLNSGVSDEIAENLMKFYPNDDGLSYEEVLLQQASMYQSFQEFEKNKRDDDINDLIHLLADEGESSRREDVMTQEAIDEALARSLQELGEGFDDLIITEHSGTANGSTHSTGATPSRAASMSSMQDSIDLDSMQYEELLQLAEVVGIENRGVSASRISQLPTSKYRSRLFSKNKKKEENFSCVICQTEFSFGERLITLPCLHQYHSKCISDWLKLKKNCPICQKEVV